MGELPGERVEGTACLVALFVCLAPTTIGGLASTILLYAILRLQGSFRLNPTHAPGMSPLLSFNTAISFITGTNWQAYEGETAASYFADMAGLVVAQFTAAAVGLAVALAVVRGIAGSTALPGNPGRIGNFWADLKLLGTNGGSMYGAGGAHPFENPTGFTNIFELTGRFAPIMLALAIAGSLRAPGSMPDQGHPRHRGRDVRRIPHGRHRDRRRTHLLPDAHPRTDRRAHRRLRMRARP